MPVLNKGQWEAPFWGTSKKFISGIDMLGMQNTSIATYPGYFPALRILPGGYAIMDFMYGFLNNMQ